MEPATDAPRAYVPFHPAVKSSQPHDYSVLSAREKACKNITNQWNRQTNRVFSLIKMLINVFFWWVCLRFRRLLFLQRSVWYRNSVFPFHAQSLRYFKMCCEFTAVVGGDGLQGFPVWEEQRIAVGRSRRMMTPPAAVFFMELKLRLNQKHCVSKLLLSDKRQKE